MDWAKAVMALTVIAAACTPLAPAEVSPSPSSVARATPRPRLTPRPPATATPLRTPRPSATALASGATGRLAAPVDTARPALGLPVVNGVCSEWPNEPEIVTLMTNLTLPPSLCLLRTTRDRVGQMVCTVEGCVPIRASCAEQGSCIEVVESEHSHFVLVYFGPLPTLPASLAEGAVLTRHLCTLHQERTRSDATLRGRGSPDWLATLEGTEFQAAFAFFRSAYAADALRWGVQLSDVENYADVCNAWYYPASRDQQVGAYQPLLIFAQKWLPR